MTCLCLHVRFVFAQELLELHQVQDEGDIFGEELVDRFVVS